MLGGFFATVEGFLATARVFFASVVVFCDGNRGLLHRRRSTAERGLVRGFFATVGVGGFLRQCWGGFLRQWKGFLATARVFFCISGGFLRR